MSSYIRQAISKRFTVLLEKINLQFKLEYDFVVKVNIHFKIL